MNENIEKLMQEARCKGICIDGYRYMRVCDKKSLVNYYLSNPDWCMERDFPTLEQIKEWFGNQEEQGIYIGRHFKNEELSEKQVYIFHNCKGSIKVGLNRESGVIPMVYIGNNCRLSIRGVHTPGVITPSIVPVYVFGKNDVNTQNNRYVRFVTYKQDLI